MVAPMSQVRRDLSDRRTAGAAFFDLDRTLLAGASGEVFSKAMRTAGSGQPVDPGRSAAVQAVQHGRRDAAVDGAGPPGRQRWPRAGRRWRCRLPRPSAADRAGRHGAAACRAAVRRAPGRRPADRAGHDHAVRPGQAARRSAGSRRRRRHAIRRQRRRHVRRHDRRAVRVERRQAGRRARVGRPSTGIDLAAQLRLQRQRVRHAAAGRGRPPVRGQPRSADGG